MSSFFNKLTIENFGPIKKASIEVKDMLVFIGPQASGKSTLAKLITILNDVNFKKRSTATLIKELEKYNIDSFLKSNTLIQFHTPSFTFEYKNNSEYKFNIYDIINSLHKAINIGDKELIKQTADLMILGIVIDEKQDILIRELQKHKNYGLNNNVDKLLGSLTTDRKYAEKILSVYNKDSKDTEELLRLLDVVKQVFSLITPLDSLYIPAERTFFPMIAPNIAGLVNNKVLIPQNILTAVQKFQNASVKITNLNLDIIGSLKYKHVEGLSYIYHNKNQKTLLKDSSSGIQSFLPITLLVENSLKDNFINLNYVVEEPELNLYPEAQYKLIKYLVKNCLETTRDIKTKNLIITTHSPYVLASINNLLFAHNKSKIDKDQTLKIISECSWIDTNHFNAYEVKKGTVKRIFNKKSKLIEDNIIDEVSEIIMQDFKSLAIINDK
ncbi:AAA family ATPase [Flavobacterium luteolum]|uniref:AAA family ATPase n=1 Tax=Flavobacterium luteolum TaxID=3003259 RepID=UPI00248E4D20|nr:AAA family ATPase [Flavobacterium luteolum]